MKLKVIILVMAVCLLRADLQNLADDKIDFSRQVLPILSNKCFLCHGPDPNPDTDLRLDLSESAYSDLGGYKAVDQANPGKSELLKRILSEDEPMPPADFEKQLTGPEKKILEAWIREGGSYGKHWAYEIPVRHKPGSAPNAKGSEAIDGFVVDQLKTKNIDLAPKADKHILARRTALTLIGLPPNPELLESFLKDESENAFEKYVDQLLADPRYGEHQARYWLDAVRYGDTHGLHLDNKRGIYPYRDWIVRSFNRNQPFDEFITWQLAGDLLPNPTLEQLVATGFVRMNPSTSEGGAIPAEFQAKNNFDRTENLGTVFLGMSLVCARCHTHKYDPVPQQEYYQLLAFFNSTAEPAMDGNKYVYGPVVKAPKNQAEWKEWDALHKQAESIVANANAFLATVRLKATDEARQWQNASGNAVEQVKLIAKPLKFFEGKEFVKAAKDWVVKQQNLEKGFTTSLVAKDLPNARVTKFLRRGEYDQPVGEPLSPDVISVVSPFPEGMPKNRLGLAKWIVSKENPLTSRVLINRVWQRVFGEAIVKTPEEFGLQGQQPTHPKLLDWLAVEFQESGWNLKHMLKLMVLSKTFQQSSAWRPELDDPENRFLARGPGYRLDAEVIRDTVLWGSGMMADENGGEGVKPYQPEGMWKALAHPASNTKQYVADKGDKIYRRSLYVYWKRTSPHPMMTLFDAPSRESSCVRRSRTNTSLQSLGLFNEQQRIELSRKFAERLLKEKADDVQRLDYLYKLLICRSPEKIESSVCLDLLKAMKKRYQDSPKDAEQLLATGEAARDKSLNDSDVAAWTQVIVTVLASDASIMIY